MMVFIISMNYSRMMTMTLSTKIHTPFSPHILEGWISMENVDKINKYLDKLNKDKQKIKDQDNGPNLAGDITQETDVHDFLNEDNTLLSELMEYLKELIDHSHINPPNVKKVNVGQFWSVSQYGGDYNPLHMHSGDVSFVFYTKVPDLTKEYEKEKHRYIRNKRFHSGDILFTYGGYTPFSGYQKIFTPEVGKLLMFPAYLGHAVYPFKDKKQERRSFSGNISFELFDKNAV